MAAAARADRWSRTRRRALESGLRAAARRAGAGRAAGAVLAVRPHAAARPASCRSCARWPSTATSTCSSCTRRPALWERIAAGAPRVTRRADDETARLPREPPARLLGAGLARAAARDRARRRVARAPGRAPAGTLLARVQAAVREDRPLRAGARPTRSIQVHACHGRARQVEVVRDAILHLLAADPTLEPRDVIVMCPDIEAFAPLIQATFGAGESAADEDDELPRRSDRPPDLRVRLADRSLRQTNPVLGVVARLLELAGPAADRLAGAGPGRSRAGPPALPARRRRRRAAARTGSRDSGIRWGLDAEHRAPFKLAELPAGTWRFGLDRLLLGVTMTEDEQRLFGGVLPLDDVESGAIDLAGRLAELVARLHGAVDALRTPRSGRRVGGGARRRPPTRSPPPRRATRGSARSCSGCSTTSSTRPPGIDGELELGRGPRAARRPAAGPPDAGQLPHRPPDDLHARADAVGAAPGRLPARPRRRRRSRARRRATATT